MYSEDVIEYIIHLILRISLETNCMNIIYKFLPQPGRLDPTFDCLIHHMIVKV